MNLSRQALGTLGLLIGFGLYALAGRLHSPWDSVLIGVVFMVIGVVAFRYAQGERWIQALGLLLGAYGLIRAASLH